MVVALVVAVSRALALIVGQGRIESVSRSANITLIDCWWTTGAFVYREFNKHKTSIKRCWNAREKKEKLCECGSRRMTVEVNVRICLSVSKSCKQEEERKKDRNDLMKRWKIGFNSSFRKLIFDDRLSLLGQCAEGVFKSSRWCDLQRQSSYETSKCDKNYWILTGKFSKTENVGAEKSCKIKQ